MDKNETIKRITKSKTEERKRKVRRPKNNKWVTAGCQILKNH